MKWQSWWVIMAGGDVNSGRFPMLGLEKMESSSISRIPVLMGESDPMKALQMLPGVSATSEGSSNFTVRGGNPDQNLLLMDEAIVYNAGLRRRASLIGAGCANA
jgi:hypothetical protein